MDYATRAWKEAASPRYDTVVLSAGKTVVVLDGTPTAPFKVPQRLERERYWFGAPRLVIDRASVVADNDWIDKVFAGLTGVPGFHLVSFRPKLCDATTCRVYDAELQCPVYIDEGHFDPRWIARNGDILAPFVALERSP